MTKFDRYILSQLITLFGFFALVLVMVYWVNRAVVLFDRLIADGQSAGVFVEFTALSLPNVIRIVIPIAAFAAAVYVANRLTSESELVVAQASGHSPWRMARPVLVFGTFVALLAAILTHFLVPMSISRLDARQAEISQNVTSRLLNEGQFMHPAEGVTFYIREITANGELKDVFLNDVRSDENSFTYTARQALLVNQNGSAKLLMFDGMAQTLTSDGRLSTTSFSDFAYDIAELVRAADPALRNIREISTFDLIFPTDAIAKQTGEPISSLLFEGHNRFNEAILCIVAAMIGFATMLIGSFSRFGLWKQIIGAIIALIVLKSIDNTLADIARSNAHLWFVTYGASVLGFAFSAMTLWMAARPQLLQKLRLRARA